jgi:hypothetical protein
MKAFKVFDKDWKCREFQYKVGERYVMNSLPVLCEVGFHACVKLINCFDYYKFDPKNKVAIVELYGDIVGDEDDKYATNDIEIIEELTWRQVLDLVNTGVGNSGNHNSGDWNSGDWNSGNLNSGDHNSGDWNSGDWNSGDWNTKEPEKVYFFNKLIKLSELDNIRISKAYVILNRFRMIKYRIETKTGKMIYRIETKTGKYGDWKSLSFKSSFKYFWKKLSVEERQLIINMKYFDKQIFYEITGVKI